MCIIKVVLQQGVPFGLSEERWYIIVFLYYLIISIYNIYVKYIKKIFY